MDAEALRALALDVSSDDIAVSRDAKRKLQALLSPSQLVNLLTSPASSSALEGLLSEVETVGNPDMYRLLGGSLTEMFTHPDEERRHVLFTDPAHFLIEFAVRASAAEETAIGASMLACLQRIILDTAVAPAEAAFVGRLLDTHFRNERVLRLLNCDQVEAPENTQMCTFLAANTTLLTFLFGATEGAFVDDPLLLANYLVASGVACRAVALPDSLRQTAMRVLYAPDDALYFAFACRFWGIALLRHEDNAHRDAAACVTAVMPVVNARERDEGATEAAFDVLGAAATTREGWDAVTGVLQCAALQTRLRSTSSSLRLSTLNLLLSMLTSTHVAPSFFTKDLMLDAWQTRTTPDDDVRLALWRMVLQALSFEELNRVLAAVCASFLCSAAYEENMTVRTLKLQAADYLLHRSALPESVQTRLKEYMGRGLYPTGSGGVSLMTKD